MRETAENTRQKWLRDPEAESVTAMVENAPDHMIATVYLRFVYQHVANCAAESLARFELTPSRYFALFQLMISPDGQMPVGRISELIFVHPATITSTVDQLQKAGLVRRMASDEDRRIILAKITPAGRALTQQATEALDQNFFGLAPMTAEEAAELRFLLKRVWARLSTAAD